MIELSVLEKLQNVNVEAEIWWDSSPSTFPAWREAQIQRAPDADTARRWTDQLDRFLDPGDLSRSLVRGVTTNPSLIAKSILASPEPWAQEARDLARYAGRDGSPTFWLLYLEAVRRAACFMLPMWTATGGRYGWVSGQLDPRDMFDADHMMEQALQMARTAPNLMIKVPGTRQGYDVIRRLAARGISINNTLSYTVPQFVACVRAVEAGLVEARRKGVDLARWRCVITHMIGRFGSQGDLIDQAETRGITLTQTDVRWAEVAILKRIHKLLADHAAPVKMLLSSLQVDDASAGSTTLSMHIEETAGAAIAYTCKPDFIADVMARDGEIEAFDPAAIARDVPPAVMGRLERLPYFRQAHEPDGMSADDFAAHGAFMTTQAEVSRWMRRLVDFVDRHVEAVTLRRSPLFRVAAE